MSRMDEALKRAASRGEGGGSSLPEGLAAGRRHENLEMPVVSAWHFERLPTESASEGQAPAHVEGLPPDQMFAPAPRVAPPDAAAEPAAADRARPQPQTGRYGRAFSADVAEKLVVMRGTNAMAVEEFRKLAATLHQMQLDRGTKIVMIASAVSGEGKTLTAVNLALTLSESYRRRVLLIDADLRRPKMHELFQVPSGSGLNEGLRSPTEQRLSIVEVSPRLALLPAGRPDPDPMSVLTSDRMRRVISEASATFDWVILDSPPVVLLPDTDLLAAMVDVAVLVVAAGKTPYKMIVRAVETLGRERLVGVVLNRVADSVLASGYACGDPYRAYMQISRT